MGWQPFDFHICKFEMEQWLNACDIDLAAHRLASKDFENLPTDLNMYKKKESYEGSTVGV